MKTIIWVNGSLHCGKTMIVNIFRQHKEIHKIAHHQRSIRDLYLEFKKLNIDESKRKECFSCVNPEILYDFNEYYKKSERLDVIRNNNLLTNSDLEKEYNFEFYYKLLLYSDIKVFVTTWIQLMKHWWKDIENFNCLNITIMRDPRVAWFLLDDPYTVENFCRDFEYHINSKISGPFILFEDFSINYKKIIKDLIESNSEIKIDPSNIKLPSSKFNSYINDIDLKKATLRMKNKNKYVKDFEYIEETLKDEIKYLNYPTHLNITDIIDSSK